VRGRYRILGVDCFAGSASDAVAIVTDRARSGEGGFVSLMNVHVAMTAQRDRALRAALREAWTVLPDGAPISWLERRHGAEGAERVAGPDLMLDVLRGTTDLRHVLFGSTPTVIDRLEARLSATVPGLRLAASFAPPAGTEHDPDTIAAVRAANADVLWVALGAPKQELWASRHQATLAPALLVGVGAAFDFHAGVKQRAPVWMQQAGLEWLHRLASEPRRLGWRYLSTNTRFLVSAARELVLAARPVDGRA
jgi:N-acetylglucosaminyldiphosphoundecaprenol N-acetyl-beta-D-mannosaminyltransferase